MVRNSWASFCLLASIWKAPCRSFKASQMSVFETSISLCRLFVMPRVVFNEGQNVISLLYLSNAICIISVGNIAARTALNQQEFPMFRTQTIFLECTSPLLLCFPNYLEKPDAAELYILFFLWVVKSVYHNCGWTKMIDLFALIQSFENMFWI